MAVAAGLAVANIYYNQPMLGVMERDLPGDRHRVCADGDPDRLCGGLFLLVPLGDLIERKRLIVVQFLVLVVSARRGGARP